MASYPSADAAFLAVLRDLNSIGVAVNPAKKTSAKAARATHESLSYVVEVTNPRNRIVANTLRVVDLPVAVARFVWMMSASDRLADIAFYEPKVAAFTDDGIMVPGSSYGRRMRQAHPGIDQLAGVIDRLKDDPGGCRRAAVSIYQPTDTTRQSNDIPCTFGLMYHGRDGLMHATTIMRSNNAIGLLPFNLFEFSLLAEVVATEARLTLGTMYHFAGSMHYYDDDFAKIADRLSEARTTNIREMPHMPVDPGPLGEIRALIQLEAQMRHESEKVRAPFVDEWRSRVQQTLNPYWQQFAFLLLIAIARKNNDAIAHNGFRALLLPTYASAVGELAPKATTIRAEGANALEQLFKPGPDISASTQIITRSALNESVVDFCDAYERRTGRQLGSKIAFAVQAEILDRIAARKDGSSALSQEEFDRVLERHLGGAATRQ